MNGNAVAGGGRRRRLTPQERRRLLEARARRQQLREAVDAVADALLLSLPAIAAAIVARVIGMLMAAGVLPW